MTGRDKKTGYFCDKVCDFNKICRGWWLMTGLDKKTGYFCEKVCDFIKRGSPFLEREFTHLSVLY